MIEYTENQQIKVLLIEDNPADTRFIREMLSRAGGSRFDTVAAEELKPGLELLAGDDFDVVLLDLGLPDSTGLDTLREAQAQDSKVPIIVLTGLADEALADRAVRERAQDYLIKGHVDGDLLVRSIRYAIERQRAEEALRKRDEEYRSLFEESKDVVFALGPDGRFLDINPSGIELFGYSSLREIRRAVPAVEIFQDHEEMVKLFQVIRQNGFVKEHELALKRKRGGPLTVLITANVMRDEKGDVVAYRGIMHDVTERRKLEELLIQAHKMEGIGRLAGGVAHDLNNFLTAILGYIELAARRSQEAGVCEDLREAKAAADHAIDLTRQLLLFSRREVPELKPVDMNDTVERLCKMLSRLIGENYLIVKDLYAYPINVSADPGHLEQVLMNLVVNARDAMPAGGEILISTKGLIVDESMASQKAGVQPGEYACLSVRDRGAGMDSETLSHIFEPFYSTKGTGKGTGLGLSVVYGIIAQHNGWVDVESAPEQGSRFDICLPVIKRDRVEELEPNDSLMDFRGHDEKILVVEDDEMLRHLAERMLAENGYRVATAGDAAEAEKLLTQPGQFDLIFSDVVLPDGDGINLVGTLTSRDRGLKVLFASGYSNEDQLSNIREKNYHFIPKPYELAKLLKTLRDLLTEEDVASEPRA